MSAHAAAHDLHNAPVELTDPGSGGTIRADRSPCVVNLITTAAQARTVADPSKPGALLTLHFQTDGGDCTVTFSTAFNELGATVIVFTEVGQQAVFQSVCVSAGVYAWRKISDWNMGNVPADKGEVVTTTNVITAGESGKTFFIDAAGGFVSTLPAPALGLEFTFVVKTSLTSNATIFTSGGSNIVCGQVYTLDVNSATDPDFTATADQDTITLVANKAVKGDMVYVCCDGTSWYAYAFCSVFDAITIDQAA